VIHPESGDGRADALGSSSDDGNFACEFICLNRHDFVFVIDH
jgi:hypothetical protein